MILQENLSLESDNVSFENTAIAFKYKSNDELKQSFRLYKVINSNFMTKTGPLLRKLALNVAFPIKGLIKKKFFNQFCGGESIRACQPVINKLSKNGVGAVLDYCIKGKEEETFFNVTASEIVKAILKARGASKYIPFCTVRISYLIREALLEKVNKNDVLTEREKFELKKAEERIELICKTANEFDVRIIFEAEESWKQNAIDDWAIAMMIKYNTEKPIVFNTYQLYINDKLENLKTDSIIADKQSFFLGAKLVRGAYLERERKRALELNYASPIHINKDATDRDYNLAVKHCFETIKIK